VPRGEYLVRLNNDVVVTDGWLDQLLALASAKIDPGERADSEIGLVGPMSNYATPPQLVENVPYADLGGKPVAVLFWCRGKPVAGKPMAVLFCAPQEIEATPFSRPRALRKHLWITCICPLPRDSPESKID
jgi:hypothetical protein